MSLPRKIPSEAIRAGIMRDVAALVLAFLLVPRVATGDWLDALPAMIGVALGALAIPGAGARGLSAWRARLPFQCAVCAAVAFVWCWFFRLPACVLWFAPSWIALSAAAHRTGYDLARPTAGLRRAAAAVGGLARLKYVQEGARLVLVTGCSMLLMRGFLTQNLPGSGDSKWYAALLEDTVLQTRAHVFPVWTGQSIYQFNGAIYPLRVAPSFQYLGALLDLATLHALPPITLQNLLLVLVGVGAAFTTYFSGRSILGERRWAAALIAIAYLACPGVLNVAYDADLYMSWMTVPLVPVALFAVARNASRPSWTSTLLLAGALGLSWWGHSPIALWTTAAVLVIQGVGLALNRPTRTSMIILGAGVIIFLAIAAYPVGSVLLYPPEPGVSGAGFQVASPGNISNFVRMVFPAVLMPVIPKGLTLSNFQLGYTFWLVLIASLIFGWRKRDAATFALLCVAIGIVALLTPFPGRNDGLWSIVPSFVRNITGNWVMNRLYVVLASTVSAVGAIVLCHASARTYRIALAALAIGAGWSLREGVRLSVYQSQAAPGPQNSAAIMRPENVMITRFSYLVFPQIPSTFSHGAVTPELEYRLLKSGDYATLHEGGSDAAAASRSLGTFDLDPADNDLQWLEASRDMALDEGSHYIVTLEPRPGFGAVTGVFQVAGSSMLREYLLPQFGGTRAFGLGASASPFLPISTSVPGGETVRVRFIPQGMTVGQTSHFARIGFGVYDPRSLPVQVTGWIPYQARVKAEEPCWLETPRSFQTGYVALVGGGAAEVRKSPEGLVMVRVPIGNSVVVLRYLPPLGLKALFWVSALSIAVLPFLLFVLRDSSGGVRSG